MAKKETGDNAQTFPAYILCLLFALFGFPFLCIQTWGETHVCVGIGFPSLNTGSNLFFSGTFARRRRIDINATGFFVRFPSFFFRDIRLRDNFFSGGKI